MCADALCKITTPMQRYTLINPFAEKAYSFFSKFRETIVCLRREFWFLCRVTFVYPKDNSHIKYLSVRSGKQYNVNQYILKSENVPWAKGVIRLGYFELDFHEANRKFYDGEARFC
jgi:hypothetical protein